MCPMTDWRYWITYSGFVQADTEEQAKVAALEDHKDIAPVDVELEEREAKRDD